MRLFTRPRPTWRWRRPPRNRVALLGAAVLVALAAGCSSGGGSTSDGGLGPDAPVVGQCHVLTAADVSAATNATPTVACSEPHTSVTIAVGGFPRGTVTNKHLRNGDLGVEALQRCTAAWRTTVGGDRMNQLTSVVALAYYLPDPDQLAGGARWYRCDLVIGGKDKMALENLPAHVDGLLNGSVPDGFRACRTDPEFRRGRQVPCTSDHVLRAVGTAPVAHQAGYPGANTLRAESTKVCRPVVDHWLHGRVSGGMSTSWPDATGWRLLDEHVATCWAVTTD